MGVSTETYLAARPLLRAPSVKHFLHRVAFVGGVGLLACLVIRLCSPSGHDRFANAKALADYECMVFRSAPGHEHANVCRFDDFQLSSIKSIKYADERIAEANTELARGNVAQAKTQLALAAGTATELDRRGTMIAQLVAAKIGGDVLDALDAHRGALDDKGRLDVLASLRLTHAAAPFQTTRLQTQWERVHAHDKEWLVSDARAADAVERDDAAFEEMSRAAASGDVARCEKAAAGLERTERTVDMAPFCAKVAKYVTVARRADAATLRATASLVPAPR